VPDWTDADHKTSDYFAWGETDSNRGTRLRGRKPSALYGAVEPETGQRFPAEHERLNSDCFQVSLDRFAEAFPYSHGHR
jgi:hypothetical protein